MRVLFGPENNAVRRNYLQLRIFFNNDHQLLVGKVSEENLIFKDVKYFFMLRYLVTFQSQIYFLFYKGKHYLKLFKILPRKSLTDAELFSLDRMKLILIVEQ